jgi:hypothetical protein
MSLEVVVVAVVVVDVAKGTSSVVLEVGSDRLVVVVGVVVASSVAPVTVST